MFERIRAMPRKLRNTSRLWLGHDAVVLRWATEGIVARNWGDKLNPYIVKKISGRDVVHRADIYPFPSRPVHYWIGSHLATACSDPNAVVWGAGFISNDVPIRGNPGAIHAVRGWLSHERLKRAGIAVPDIVGDAALLLPRFYSPKRHMHRVSLGIIPHCFEWNEAFFIKARKWEDARVIDITDDIEFVVEQIVSCDKIVSSSLHGIICADAYGVPALWLRASNKPAGDGFKFLDYFSSVSRPNDKPIDVDADTQRNELEEKFFEYQIDIDLNVLWRACPVR